MMTGTAVKSLSQRNARRRERELNEKISDLKEKIAKCANGKAPTSYYLSVCLLDELSEELNDLKKSKRNMNRRTIG